ncbi:MAG: protein kinase [Spirochaetota bacterium]
MQVRTVINQCYIVREKLGEDGFCELWRATSVFNATEFLLRFLKPLPGLEEKMDAFRRETMATYAIGHPAVGDLVEFEQFEGRFFLASAYLGQRTLRSLLAEGVSFGLEHLCRYILELAQGVDAFHGLDIVYGCLNSDNALFQFRQGRAEAVQVQKPGYASLLGLVEEKNLQDWIETWAYVAPEIKRNDKTIDQRADVYSLGIHLFRFLTGKLPFPEEASFVRKEAASLPHVAKALARRGVPEALVRIALRALRPDPALRYADCVRFIAELRDFTDERRALSLRREGVDPLANMETLNRAGGKIGASQIVRSLDTADYFRLLSESPAEPLTAKSSRVFPFSGFSDPNAVRSLEVTEAATPDPGRLDEDAYIREAKRAVSREPWAVLEESPPAESEQEPETQLKAEKPLELGGESEAQAENAALPVADVEPDGFEGLVLEGPRSKGKSGQGVEAGGISWQGSRFPQAGLVETMETAFAKARRGRGTFRFIQEPNSGLVAAALGRAITRFKADGLVLDAGAFKNEADTTDLLRMLRAPLAKTLGGEGLRSMRLLAKRLSTSGGEGLWAASPLGTALYGYDRPEPDPDFIDTPEGAIQIAKSLLVFGRRTRPLVLVFRNGESVAGSAHRVLLEFARLAPLAPLCCFVFFLKGSPVASWHALAHLEEAEKQAAVEGEAKPTALPARRKPVRELEKARPQSII